MKNIEALRLFFRVSNAAFAFADTVKAMIGQNTEPDAMQVMHKRALEELEKDNPDLELIDSILSAMEAQARLNKRVNAPAHKLPAGGVIAGAEAEQERPESNTAASNSGTTGNTYTAGEELTAGDLVYVANSGLIMKSEHERPFPISWYESNAFCGLISSLATLGVFATLQIKGPNMIENIDVFLDRSCISALGEATPSFGTRGEHTGEQTLRMYLQEHGLLDEFLETWNK